MLPPEVRDVTRVASDLKWVAVVEGIISFLAASAGLWAATCALAVPVCLVAAPAVGVAGLAAAGVVLVAGGALTLIAVGLDHVARAWRRLRPGPALVTMVLAAVPLAPFCGLASLFMMVCAAGSVPALLSLLRLKKTPVAYLVPGRAVFGTLGDVLRRPLVFATAVDGDARRDRRLAVAKLFLAAAGIQISAGLVVGLIMLGVTGGIRNENSAQAFNLILSLPLFALSFIISSELARRVHDTRWIGAPSAASARAADPRPPVLLLRSFSDEEPLTKGGGVQFFSLTRASVYSFEEHLTDRLWRFGPVVAIGRSGEPQPPPGAAREYLQVQSNSDWQGRVLTVADASTTIVLVAGKTPGVAWECQRIIQRGRSDRLLAVIPRWMSTSEWVGFCDGVGLNKKFKALGGISLRRPVLGIGFDGAKPIVYTGPQNEFGYEALSLVAVAESANRVAVVAGPPALSPEACSTDQQAVSAAFQASAVSAQPGPVGRAAVTTDWPTMVE